MSVIFATLSAMAGEVTFKASADGFGPGQRIGTRLVELLKPYSGSPDTTATVKIVFDRPGIYRLDRSLNVHCNLEMSGVKGATIEIVNDFKYSDNCAISVCVAQGFPMKVNVHDLSFTMEKHNEILYTKSPRYLLKFWNCKEVNISNCTTSLYNGVITDLQILNSRNITVKGNSFTNHNNCREGGILWIVGSCENVEISDNKFEKYGNDEAIGFYEGNRTHLNREDYTRKVVRRNIAIERNVINYARPSWVKADSLISNDILISFYSQGVNHKTKYDATFEFSGVTFRDNTVNILTTIKRILTFSADTRTRYSDIVFSNNSFNINIKKPDASSMIIFDIATAGNSSDPIKIVGNEVNGRLKSMADGSKVNTHLLYVENANLLVSSNLLNLNGCNSNVIRTNSDSYTNGATDHSRITLLDNSFLNLYLLGSIGRKSTTADFSLKAYRNVIEGKTKLYMKNVAKADLDYQGNTFRCNGYELLLQNFARQGTLNFTDNTVEFSGRNDFTVYANYEKGGNSDKFTRLTFSDNIIRGIQANKLNMNNIPVSPRNAKLTGNRFW